MRKTPIAERTKPGEMMTEKLPPEIRGQIIEKTAKLIVENYVFPDVADRMATTILRKMESGEYGDCQTAVELGGQLTEDLRAISNDLHLAVFYHPQEAARILEKQAQDPLNESYESDWWHGVHSDNFGLKKIEYLIGNVGYIDIRYFAPVNLAGQVAVAAMDFLSRCDALIFDLRQCGGGDPFMVQLIESYLFDEHKKPKLLMNQYQRARDEVHQSWTYPYVPGKHIPDVPVFVLTSKRTFSGGEDMAYTLKHHGRAIIVGETTGGGAHPVTELTPGEGFVIILPDGYPTHPVTKANWEGSGVQPDIEVSREQVLEVAHRHALQSLMGKHDDPARTHTLDWCVQRLAAIYRPLALDPTELEKYTGQYRDYEVKIQAGRLVLSRIGREDDWPMLPISEHSFTADDDYNARFDVDEDGTVNALIWMGRDTDQEIRVARTNEND